MSAERWESPDDGSGWRLGNGPAGFTIIEVLMAMGIMAIVMSIIYGVFSSSSANAKAMNERADELSALTGTVDLLSQDIRSVFLYEGRSNPLEGDEDSLEFTALTPLVRDGEPRVQRVQYLFSEGKLVRMVVSDNEEEKAKTESELLAEIKDPSFRFHNGKEWVTEWKEAASLPRGVKVAFTYRDRVMENVIPIWVAKR